LSIDKRSVLQYGWYHVFLVATDRRKEAVKLARARAEANPGDAPLAALHGAFLYADRQFGAAKKVLEETAELDSNCWSAHLILSLVTYALDDPAQAYFRLSRTDYCLSPDGKRPFFPGLSALFYLHSGSHFKRSVLDESIEMLAEAGGLSFVQLGLACMGMKDYTSMYKQFFRAWRFYDPVMLFMNALPIFDSVCEQPYFQELRTHRLSKRDEARISFAEDLDADSETEIIRKIPKRKGRSAKP
jgi:tetratricopeptide (TPR) repeat protein